ncbi:MAG: argininosuccinate synthase [Elusimicrobiota bacterium]
MVKISNKIVLAYSGGLDTSVMIPWLKEKYGGEIIAVCVDVGQNEDFAPLKAKAKKSGAAKYYLVDAKDEFVREYIFPALQANAVYENKYLLATALARPLIAKKVVEIAQKEQAGALSHGATGKGNDQVRFELTFKSLAPEMKIIAPWREWDLRSRQEEMAYARQRNIPVPVSKKKPYSCDCNLAHLSFEGGILEDLTREPGAAMFQWTVSPEKSPGKPLYLEIGFVAGIPKTINGKTSSPVNLMKKLNQLGSAYGIGRVDIVENRLVGIKSRGVYECPGMTLLLLAHRELESLTLDRETAHYKEFVSLRYAELVYFGLWFSPLKQAIDAFIKQTQHNVTGSVRLKLYKGQAVPVGRKSPFSLYWQELATFEADSVYNQKDAEGFINLFGLPLKVAALQKKFRK